MAKTKSNKSITLIKAYDTSVAPGSEQKTEKPIKGEMIPDIPFYLLINTVESSFILGGIIEKIATRADSGFEDFNEDEIAKFPKEQVDHLRNLLDAFDVHHAITNLAVCGNYWLEVTGGQNTQKLWDIDLIPFLTLECILDADWRLHQKNGHGDNPFEQEQYIQLKRRSLKTRYYGDSVFAKCVRQIVTLEAIDKYYGGFFEGGLINTKLITDPEGNLDDKDIAIIRETIRDRMRGIDNSFATAIVPTKLETVDISSEMDIKGLVEYRRDLLRSIAIALNIPYDMLDSQNSNRATSEASQEDFNTNVVAPLQQHFVRQLKHGLKPYFGDLVEVIELKSIDTKNQKEEMEIYTGYKTAGILTANEVREELGWDTVDGGDTLETSKKPDVPMTPEEINNVNKIKKSLAEGYGNLLSWQK